MKSVLKWAIKNSPAMNIAMIALLIAGGVSFMTMRREVFPEFELEIILVSVPYPGASPEEVEEGICLKMEEAVRSIDGVKKQTSVAQEGAGHLVLEIEAGRDVQKILNEVRSEIDRIPSFPALAEDPEVKQITFRVPAIKVGVIELSGRTEDDLESELRLRDVAEEVRNDLLQLETVSQANVSGANEFQIDVEISEETLRKHGLTLQEVARRVRRENVELPGGSMKTQSQEVLLRGKNKRLWGEQIREIPLVTLENGAVLTVDDLGEVNDGFEDRAALSRVNGKPGLVISVDRTKSEDQLLLSDDVRGYVAEHEYAYPGYRLVTWADQSDDIRERMELLVRNGCTGLILVFIVLALFLDLRLAFWVALGIPVAVMGAGAVMILTGQTLNMLSMFAFLMALGIVVDDAIVIGENVYRHREMGKPYMRAAIDGASQVLPSVTTSVLTTVIAFMPMFFVSGVMGKFFAVLPLAVIAMLIISLLESAFVLPVHLAHRDNLFLKVLGFLLYPFWWIGWGLNWVRAHVNAGMQWFVERAYLPMLSWLLRYPAVPITSAVGLMLIAVGMVAAGIVPWNLWPKMDNPTIEATITYPDGTPKHVTAEATRRLEETIREIAREYEARGEPILLVSHRAVGQVNSPGAIGPSALTDGSHVGSVEVRLVSTNQRSVKSQEIVDEWRKRAGEFPGAESVIFGSPQMGPGGKPIEFKLLAPGDEEGLAKLEAAVEEAKQKLAGYDGLYGIDDDSKPGKWEYQLRTKPRAEAMGVPLADVAETVRASYYGEEVMRLQRGRHEVKLMVRYPAEERRSLAGFEDLRVRTGDGSERPITELADWEIKRGYNEINRIEQLRSITVSADIDESKANAAQIVSELKHDFQPYIQEKYDGQVHFRWEGQEEQQRESMSSLFVGFGIAALCMFVLLVLEFRSYFQPAIIMAIIPFGFVGAVLGHLVLGMPFTMFSVLGMVALTGVVVNDSIVLVDFINEQVRNGMPLRDALLEAGRRRFRAVVLTSVTTVAGLMPMLLETSFQAQILIPMATSLCFGLMLATLLVLVLVPVFYFVYGRLFLRDVPVSEDEADWAEPAHEHLLPPSHEHRKTPEAVPM